MAVLSAAVTMYSGVLGHNGSCRQAQAAMPTVFAAACHRCCLVSPDPTRRFDRGTLYCSPPTALLVQQQLRVKPGCIRCGPAAQLGGCPAPVCI